MLQERLWQCSVNHNVALLSFSRGYFEVVISQPKKNIDCSILFSRFIQQNTQFGGNIHYLGWFQRRQDVIKLKC